METLLMIAMKNYSRATHDYGDRKDGDGKGPFDGTVDLDGDGRLDIDCSHLANNVLKTAGYNIPYLTTRQLHSKNIQERYFDVVPLEEGTEDDLILYAGHVGIFQKFNSTTKTGTYFGAQSKGPDIAKIDEAGTFGWGLDFILLRPKAALRTKPSERTYKTETSPAPPTHHPDPVKSTNATRWSGVSFGNYAGVAGSRGRR